MITINCGNVAYDLWPSHNTALATLTTESNTNDLIVTYVLSLPSGRPRWPAYS